MLKYVAVEQHLITQIPLVKGDNLFSRIANTASIYLCCTSRVCNKSKNVSQDEQYSTQGSFEHLTSFLDQFIGVIWITDFWCSTTVNCQKLFLFTIKHPAFLFPHSDKQLMTQHWFSRDGLPASLVPVQNRNPCRCTGPISKNSKAACCCFTAIFQKTAYTWLVNHYLFICHSCIMTLASSFVRNALL